VVIDGESLSTMVTRYDDTGLKRLRQGLLMGGTVLLGCVWLLLLGGCAPPDALPSSTEETPMVVIRQADAGQVVEVQTGDRLAVWLPENPSTGYQWNLFQVDDAILQLRDSAFVQGEAGIPGSGGVRQLQFEAQTPGETALILHLQRPWEAETAPIESFEVTVQVR
jgi:inhibitor of cysteine peptidase